MVSFRIGGFKFFSSKKPITFDPSDDVLQGCRHKLRVEITAILSGGGFGGRERRSEHKKLSNCGPLDVMFQLQTLPS